MASYDRGLGDAVFDEDQAKHSKRMTLAVAITLSVVVVGIIISMVVIGVEYYEHKKKAAKSESASEPSSTKSSTSSPTKPPSQPLAKAAARKSHVSMPHA